ncbi:MAG TPA: M17 family metallopeptidase [Pseudonocardia sp.]|uniref:leucyl aminopeptidase family protein n=1 Tax=Pseudonocardia sp. TaxID=60912 RepID=UPI002ED82F11
MPTPLLAVAAVARPDERAEQVVLLDTEGHQRAWAVPGTDPGVDPALIDRLGATGKAGEVHLLPDGRWLLGVGNGADAAGLRRAGATLAGALRARAERARANQADSEQNTTEPEPQPDENPSAADPPVALAVAELSESSRAAVVIGLILGSHQFRVSQRQPPAPGRAELVVPEAELADLAGQVEVAGALAAATALARDLASTPSDVKTPVWLVSTAADLAAEVPGLSATVWPAQQLAEEGFGGLLAVGGGSSRPPALLRLDWAPPAAGSPGVGSAGVGSAGVGSAGAGSTGAGSTSQSTEPRHLVLIGKGITFDTGGISIKPADGMHLMRTDMAGGGAVIAALLSIARLGLPLRVTGLVPAAENHVSGSAYRPGDIVRHYDGTTTEVVNTDAEGRMVLADALGYAVRELAPDLIVDAATLTGAMKVSLGMRTGGLFATEDQLADALLAAGERAGERWWRMPLLDHVADEVDSTIADLRQAPPGPPAISAAQFLRRFTGGLPWAHLDIAGPARCDKAYDEVAVGATGFAARTMVELALGYVSR